MTQVTITARNPEYNGVSAGVRFTDGKAVIDSEKQLAALEYFARHAFGISHDVKSDADPDLSVKKVNAPKAEARTKAAKNGKTKKPGEKVDPKTATEAQAGIESANAPAGAGDGPAGALHNAGRDAANPDGAEPPVTPSDAGI